MSTLQSTTTIASIVGGEARTDAPGGRLTSTNPARTSEVVAEVLLGDAATFADACAAARAAQRDWAKVPAPVPQPDTSERIAKCFPVLTKTVLD